MDFKKPLSVAVIGLALFGAVKAVEYAANTACDTYNAYDFYTNAHADNMDYQKQFYDNMCRQ